MIKVPMQFQQPVLIKDGVVPLGSWGFAACCWGCGTSWGLINCCDCPC
ncbi:MAG: hypothetical protein WBA22_12600 [Candidatus Methanofastidiosia archaeon]